MLDVGLNEIRDLHAANIDKAWMGLSGTVVDESQTGLIDGVTASKVAATVVKSDRTNVVTYTLGSGSATANTYREFAVMLDGTVEYNRTTFTGEEHTSNDDIVVRQTFFYKNP